METKSELIKELFTIAERDYVIAERITKKIKKGSIPYDILVKSFKTKKSNCQKLIILLLEKVDKNTLSKKVLLTSLKKTDCYFATCSNVYLLVNYLGDQFLLKELIDLLERSYWDISTNKIFELLRKADVSKLKYTDLIMYQNKSSGDIRKITEELLLKIPKEELSYETLIDYVKNSEGHMKSVSMKLLLKNFADKLTNDMLVRFLSYCGDTTPIKISNIILERINKGEIPIEFWNKYLKSKTIRISDNLIYDFILKYDVSSDQKSEIDDFILKYRL